MSKAIFRWDANGYFCSSDVKPDDYQLKENETFDEPKFNDPSNALTPYKSVAGGWQASNQEEHDAWVKKQFELEHPGYKEQPAQPSAQDEALNALGLQLAQVQQTQATQAQAINALGLQFAAAQGNDAKTQGGNQ